MTKPKGCTQPRKGAAMASDPELALILRVAKLSGELGHMTDLWASVCEERDALKASAERWERSACFYRGENVRLRAALVKAISAPPADLEHICWTALEGGGNGE